MYGLHVYINSDVEDSKNKRGVFYSRRGAGPYYRWAYVEEKDRWCFVRVRLDLVPHSLRTAQKSVPNALRTELLAHYLD